MYDSTVSLLDYSACTYWLTPVSKFCSTLSYWTRAFKAVFWHTEAVCWPKQPCQREQPANKDPWVILMTLKSNSNITGCSSLWTIMCLWQHSENQMCSHCCFYCWIPSLPLEAFCVPQKECVVSKTVSLNNSASCIKYICTFAVAV